MKIPDAKPVGYAVTPFPRPGQFVVPAIHHQDGHAFYCHVVLPPFFQSLPSEKRRELIESAHLKAQLGLSIMVASQFKHGGAHA